MGNVILDLTVKHTAASVFRVSASCHGCTGRPPGLRVWRARPLLTAGLSAAIRLLFQAATHLWPQVPLSVRQNVLLTARRRSQSPERKQKWARSHDVLGSRRPPKTRKNSSKTSSLSVKVPKQSTHARIHGNTPTLGNRRFRVFL